MFVPEWMNYTYFSSFLLALGLVSDSKVWVVLSILTFFSFLFYSFIYIYIVLTLQYFRFWEYLIF